MNPAAPTPGDVPNVYGAANSTNETPAAVPVGRAAELAATVREALDFSKGVTGQEQITVALAALSELAALAREQSEVEQEAALNLIVYMGRAEAAEAENTRLRAALREIADWWLHNIPGVSRDGSASSSTMAQTLARAALAQHTQEHA